LSSCGHTDHSSEERPNLRRGRERGDHLTYAHTLPSLHSHSLRRPDEISKPCVLDLSGCCFCDPRRTCRRWNVLMYLKGCSPLRSAIMSEWLNAIRLKKAMVQYYTVTYVHRPANRDDKNIKTQPPSPPRPTKTPGQSTSPQHRQPRPSHTHPASTPCSSPSAPAPSPPPSCSPR